MNNALDFSDKVALVTGAEDECALNGAMRSALG
jgi:hypothetical protein